MIIKYRNATSANSFKFAVWPCRTNHDDAKLKLFESLHHWNTGLNRRIGCLILVSVLLRALVLCSVHHVYSCSLIYCISYSQSCTLHHLLKQVFLWLLSLRCGWNLEQSSPSSTGTTCWNQASGESLRTQCSTKEWWSTPWRMCPWWVPPTRTLYGPSEDISSLPVFISDTLKWDVLLLVRLHGVFLHKIATTPLLFSVSKLFVQFFSWRSLFSGFWCGSKVHAGLSASRSHVHSSVPPSRRGRIHQEWRRADIKSHQQMDLFFSLSLNQ